MVGDRIDIDIAPAKNLGMGTILVLTDSHAIQKPRSWLELPDYEASIVEDLTNILDNLSSYSAVLQATPFACISHFG